MSAPVGVLALQGGFSAHRRALAVAGIDSVEVRDARGLVGLAGLVLPGGESTAMLTILRRRGMLEPLAAFGRGGVPVLATCAGLILAAHSALSWLDLDVQRNAYGSQLDSFEARSDDGAVALVFIRAPRIETVGPGVEVLARHRGDPVLVRQGAVVGATFHPELSGSADLHAEVFACR
jgi:5'-phosphate synthase pdxT subunit